MVFKNIIVGQFNLARLDDNEIVCVINIERHLTPADLEERLHIHSGAVGKVLVSGKSWSDVEKIINIQGMPNLTPKTITNQEKFEEEIKKVQKQGFACTMEETQPNLCCVAAPIYDDNGQIVASMSLSMPSAFYSYHEKEMVIEIHTSCHEVSQQLGYLNHSLPVQFH